MPQDRRGRGYEGDETYPELALASAARTTSGNGPTFAVESLDSLKARLNITATSGTTPTLDARLDVSYDGGTTFEDPQAWAQKTANGSDFKQFNVSLATHARWAWTIGGTTPSFTFAIDNVAGERSR